MAVQPIESAIKNKPPTMENTQKGNFEMAKQAEAEKNLVPRNSVENNKGSKIDTKA